MFKPQFRNLVISGEKRQTIRPNPKRLPRLGDQESWREWIGIPYRSKQRELAKVVIRDVQRITITADRMELDGKDLSSSDQSRLAKADGFNCLQDMLDWFSFTHGLPFNGILIRVESVPMERNEDVGVVE